MTAETAEKEHIETVKHSRCLKVKNWRETKEIRLEATKALRAEHTDFKKVFLSDFLQ